MTFIKSKHVLKAIFVSTVFYAVVYSIVVSIWQNAVNLMGFVISFYYLIPVTLFTLILFTLIGILVEVRFKFSSSIFFWLLLSIFLGFIFLTIWVIYDGEENNYFGKSFFYYWVEELERLWTIMVYYILAIPIIFYFLANRKL